MINHLIASTSSPEATIVSAAIAYVRVGLRAIRLAPLHPESTPTTPRCSCRDGCAVHVCPSPTCPTHPFDAPGTVHSSAGEHPAGSMSWQNIHATEQDARSRFRPRDGVGLVMGRCDLGYLVAIDLDGDVGVATMRALCDRYGRPPTTLTAATGGGGVHLIYRLAPVAGDWEVRNTRSEHGDAGPPRYPGLHLSARGGYVAASPTLHWSGRRYRWTRPRLPTELPREWCEVLMRISAGTEARVDVDRPQTCG